MPRIQILNPNSSGRAHIMGTLINLAAKAGRWMAGWQGGVEFTPGYDGSSHQKLIAGPSRLPACLLCCGGWKGASCRASRPPCAALPPCLKLLPLSISVVKTNAAVLHACMGTRSMICTDESSVVLSLAYLGRSTASPLAWGFSVESPRILWSFRLRAWDSEHVHDTDRPLSGLQAQGFML